jgi:hypothetical protein
VSRKVTTSTIEKYLKRFGVTGTATRHDGVRQGVSATLEVPGLTWTVHVDLADETGQLEFRVPRLLLASLDDTPADRVHGLLLAMGALNYRIPLGTLAYDPSDGEVALRYAMPVVGGELHYEDFEQVLVVLQNVVAKHVSDLRAVVAGEKTAREILR